VLLNPAPFASQVFGYRQGMINGTLVASVASNALTIAVKTFGSADPSPESPVLVLITDASGGYSVLTLTAATSLFRPAPLSVPPIASPSVYGSSASMMPARSGLAS